MLTLPPKQTAGLASQTTCMCPSTLASDSENLMGHIGFAPYHVCSIKTSINIRTCMHCALPAVVLACGGASLVQSDSFLGWFRRLLLDWWGRRLAFV